MNRTSFTILQADGVRDRAMLLVDPDPELLRIRYMLLAASQYSVRALTNYHEVFLLEPEDDPMVAVLSDSLGTFALRAVAEYLRHRWPQTRILIIGKAAPVLDDHLYDETLDASFNPKMFLETVDRCSKRLL